MDSNWSFSIGPVTIGDFPKEASERTFNWFTNRRLTKNDLRDAEPEAINQAEAAIEAAIHIMESGVLGEITRVQVNLAGWASTDKTQTACQVTVVANSD